MVQVIPGLFAKELAWFVPVRDLGWVDAKEGDTDLSLVVGDGCEGVLIAHPLNDGDEAGRGEGGTGDPDQEARAGRVDNPWKPEMGTFSLKPELSRWSHAANGLCTFAVGHQGLRDLADFTDPPPPDFTFAPFTYDKQHRGLEFNPWRRARGSWPRWSGAGGSPPDRAEGA